MDRRALLLGGGIFGVAGALTSPVAAQAAPTGPSAPLGVISVADYGARGDGRSDDTAAVTAAIAAVAGRNVSGDATGVVWFPAGVYRCRTTIIVPKNIQLMGESMEASKLVYSGGADAVPFVTFGSRGMINTNCGVLRMQIDAAARLPWSVLLHGPQEGSRISGAHVCGGTVGGVDVRSAGVEGGSNKFVVDGSWIWTSGDSGMYGLRFDDANGPLAIRDVTCVGTGRSKAAPADSAGLYFDGGIQHVTGVNVERFASHTSIDAWSSFHGDTLSAYGGVSTYIRRRRHAGADPAVRFSVENLVQSDVQNTIVDEQDGITVPSARRYSNREIDSAAWNGAHLTIGAFHLWVDSSGRLRMKATAPSADTDGVVVGAQG